jgi:hypothetical protein
MRRVRVSRLAEATRPTEPDRVAIGWNQTRSKRAVLERDPVGQKRLNQVQLRASSSTFLNATIDG